MRLTNKIHLLRIDFYISIDSTTKIPRFVNVLIIFGDKITLIDTGVKGSERLIFDYIIKEGREITDIDILIISHSHPDHIGSAAKIKEITGCKVIAHQLEQNWIEHIELQHKERPVPGFLELVDTSVQLDSAINEDCREIKLQNDLTLKLIKSSGHSSGMLNVFFVEDEILFTADSIPLKNDIPNYINYIELMESLHRIKNNSEYRILLTSWTPPLTEKVEIQNIISEGEAYMQKIDLVVKRHYVKPDTGTIENYQQIVKELKLPQFLLSPKMYPIINKAFNSHII